MDKNKDIEGKEIPIPIEGEVPDNKIPSIISKSKNMKDNADMQKYQMTLSESILLRGVCDLVKSYQNDLDNDNELMENEKYQLRCVVDDLRELLEKVEGLY